MMDLGPGTQLCSHEAEKEQIRKLFLKVINGENFLILCQYLDLLEVHEGSLAAHFSRVSHVWKMVHQGYLTLCARHFRKCL